MGPNWRNCFFDFCIHWLLPTVSKSRIPFSICKSRKSKWSLPYTVFSKTLFLSSLCLFSSESIINLFFFNFVKIKITCKAFHLLKALELKIWSIFTCMWTTVKFRASSSLQKENAFSIVHHFPVILSSKQWLIYFLSFYISYSAQLRWMSSYNKLSFLEFFLFKRQSNGEKGNNARRRERERSFLHWWTLQITTMMGAETG